MAVGATRQWKGVGCFLTASGCPVVVAGTGAGVGARATTGRERGIEQWVSRAIVPSLTRGTDRGGGWRACVAEGSGAVRVRAWVLGR